MQERDQTIGFDSARAISRARDVFFKAMTWRSGATRSLARKIMSSDVSGVQCWTNTVRKMAIDFPPEEQVEDKDLIREFVRLTKMIVNSCESIGTMCSLRCISWLAFCHQ